MGAPATYEGGHVVDTEGPRLPCSLNQGFFSFEAQIEEVVSKQHTNRGERLEFIRNMMTEANRRWCGGCPVKAACLERALLDHHTGIAGGAFLVKGKVQ